MIPPNHLPLSDLGEARWRRHGRGVQGRGHQVGSFRRLEVFAGRICQRSSGAGATTRGRRMATRPPMTNPRLPAKEDYARNDHHGSDQCVQQHPRDGTGRRLLRIPIRNACKYLSEIFTRSCGRTVLFFVDHTGRRSYSTAGRKSLTLASNGISGKWGFAKSHIPKRQERPLLCSSFRARSKSRLKKCI